MRNSVHWPSAILKIALKEPFKESGVRFWDMGSGLFLNYSAKDMEDEEDGKKIIMTYQGWQILKDEIGSNIKIERETARMILSGIITRMVMR